ncbi:DUF72 domain-containing protein [Sphingomonas sp.]|jgi:uncharacterized protein YecE (DUF72 family)|uniref:DUF72 domain-containing protein n=1 Tax=Sphingomonas sp. TaxID=28214 RepID=UPI002D7F89E9|nr:DUF72 domain-containing protein [Sphingomonas sp.]HEU0045539.1 DUF72 domain-containing protein [Sphingomonas sp.]
MAMIRVGIGGWTYEPWRDNFYPAKWPHKRELEYASRQLSAIEINGTFYSSFKPASWANWRDTVPDGFVFAVKGSRYCVTRKVLAEASESVQRFVGQGLTELGDKLGPILWQFAPTRRFDPDDLGAFLALLPRVQDGVPLRHAVQARHESFGCAAFVELARTAGVTIVYADSEKYGAVADVTGEFVYARLEQAEEANPDGYPAQALDRWADTARRWAAGEQPEGLPYVAAAPPPRTPRETFIFFINGAKARAPAGAQALIARLRG